MSSWIAGDAQPVCRCAEVVLFGDGKKQWQKIQIGVHCPAQLTSQSRNDRIPIPGATLHVPLNR